MTQMNYFRFVEKDMSNVDISSKDSEEISGIYALTARCEELEAKVTEKTVRRALWPTSYGVKLRCALVLPCCKEKISALKDASDEVMMCFDDSSLLLVQFKRHTARHTLMTSVLFVIFRMSMGQCFHSVDETRATEVLEEAASREEGELAKLAADLQASRNEINTLQAKMWSKFGKDLHFGAH